MLFFQRFSTAVRWLLSVGTVLVFGLILLPIAWAASKVMSVFAFGPAWMWFTLMAVVAVGSVCHYNPRKGVRQ